MQDTGKKPIDHLFWFAPSGEMDVLEGDLIIDAQNDGVIQCFRTIKALLSLGYANRKLAWTVFTRHTQATYATESINPTHAGFHGLVGSMAKEFQDWKVRLIDLDRDFSWSQFTGKGLKDQPFLALPHDPEGNPWIYRKGEWLQTKLVPPGAGSGTTEPLPQGGEPTW